MPVNILVTLDLFLRDWHLPAGGELWLCAQPHLEGADALMEWIETSATSAAHSYRLLSLGDDPHGDFIPVNFASDMDITVELIGFEGDEPVRVLPPVTNARRTGVLITNPQTFKEANVERQSPEHQNLSGRPAAGEYESIKDVYAAPFAVGYNKSLLDAKLGRDSEALPPSTVPPDKGKLADLLTLAFWGGRRKFLPRDAARDLGAVSLMDLRDPRPHLLATNLHSLNGLMFLLGTKAQAALLGRTRQVRISGRRASGEVFSITSPDAAVMDQSFAAFFGKLPAASIRPPGELIRSAAAGNFDRRVYVLDSLIPFNHQRINNESWFRRRAEDAGVSDDLKLSGLRRMVVRIRKKEDGTEPTRDEYEKAATFRWAAYETYDARLVPYRSARALAAGNPGAAIPLHLVPNERSQSLFYREIREACDKGEDPLARMELFDKSGTRINPEPLGCYNFIWDQLSPDSEEPDEEIRTVLYLGVPPPSPEVTVRFARPISRSGDVKFIQPALKDDPWGVRLEFVPAAPLADASFDTLIASRPPGSPDDAAMIALAERLTPGLAFHSDLQFQFAQSASSSEVLLQVTYPAHSEPANPGDTDPAQEYLADLVNHNAVRAVALWERRGGGTPRAFEVNPRGQIFPVSKEAGPPLNHFFKVDYRFPITPPSARLGEAAPNVPAFFNELYRDMGTQRRYQLDLEHTYGTSLRLDDLGDLSSHVDFMVAMPTEVRAIVGEAGAAAAPCDSDFPTPLLTIDYNAGPCPGAAAGTECLTLVFNRALLDRALYDSERCRSTYVDAWRCIAELARAERVMLRGRFYEFDFRAGLAQDRPGRIADALKLLDGSKQWFTEISGVVRERCRRWIETGVVDNPEIKVSLSPLGGKPIGKACHVCEFQLEVTRPQEIQPPDKAWDLRRTRPEFNSREGQRTEPDNSNAAPLFEIFLKNLRSRLTSIEPAEEDRLLSDEFRRRVGEPGGADRRGAAWVLPNEISPETSPDERAVPSACPLGFLPLRKHDYLGDATTTLMRRYFAALKLVLELGTPGVWSDWGRAQWAEFFNSLNSLTADEASPLRSMLAKLQGLLLPLPPADLPAGGPAQNPEIKSVVEEMRRDSDLRGHMRAWLHRRVLSDPGIFDEAKALLYTRLRGEAGSRLLTKDFYELVSHKLIRTTQVPGSQDQQKVTDKDRYTFRQSLTRLRDKPWFGYLEILDDVRYDNEFQFEDFQLRSFEDVVEQIGDPEKPQASSIVIKDRLLHLPCNPEKAGQMAGGVPCGAQRLEAAEPLERRPEVRLASRETLSNPVHLFTGRIERFETAEGIEGLVPGSKFLLKKLQRGIFDGALVAGEPTVQLRAKSTPFPRSRRLDDYVQTSIFTIRSDEESANAPDTPQDIANSFANDRFFASRLVNITPVKATDPVPGPDPLIVSLFKTLADNPKLSRLDDPRDVIDPRTLGFVSQALVQADPPNPDLPADNEFKVALAGGELTLSFAGPGERVAEALLFSIDSGQAGPPSTQPLSYVLVVNLQVPVWQPSSIGLVHKRNVFADFAPEFGQASVLISDAIPYQPIIESDLERLGPQTWSSDKRDISVAEIVRAVLNLRSQNQLADESVWRNFDLSVKTFQVQRTQVRALFPGAKGFTELTRPSPFPLLNRFIKGGDGAGQDHPDTWFPPLYGEFIVELQWSSPSNLQFFGIRNYFVRFRP